MATPLPALPVAENSTRKRRLGRVVLLVAVVALVVWLFASGTYREFHAERMRDVLLELGPYGPLVYMLAFTFLQPLGVSGQLFVVGAGMVWSGPFAFLIALTGALASQLLGFLFYRHVLHDWAQRHVPARFRRYETALMRRPVRMVILLRVLTFTWTLAPLMLGASRVRFMPMFVGTLLGLLPGVGLGIWLGEGVLAWLTR